MATMAAADRRLLALSATGLLDSPAEPRFDRLTRLAAASVGAPVALISLVDADRQFFKSAVGLAEPWASLRETKLTHSFCRHVMESGAPLMVNDSRAHALVAGNPAIEELGVAACLGVPLQDRDGHVLGSLCAIDAVPRTWQARDLALLQGLAELVEDEIETSRARSTLADAERHWRTVLNIVPQMVWSTLPDGRVDYYNSRWYEFTGVAPGETDGDTWPAVFHPEDQARALAVWRNAVATGGFYEIEYRLRHHSGEYRWALGRGVPLRAEDGSIVRWFGTCTDIHALKRSEEARDLVTQELSHRIKNIFTVVSAIVSLSAREAPEAAVFSGRLTDRLLALATAHDHVLPRSGAHSGLPEDGQSLHGICESLLAPYRARHNRIDIAETKLRVGVSAASSLALVIHELATNAMKYGALSVSGGAVSLDCEESEPEISLIWQERGGPPIEATPEKSGFGSSLVMRAATMQLGGKLTYDWGRDGLTMTFRIPRERLLT
ncbi:MAG TPA: PAS domain-containing protein [Acetobacteraceae bacterium]|nr:PAS domain-containing protein [Acetobacteraceae bacterium]